MSTMHLKELNMQKLHFRVLCIIGPYFNHLKVRKIVFQCPKAVPKVALSFGIEEQKVNSSTLKQNG